MRTQDETPGENPRRLERNVTNRWIAGVCGGLGIYFKVDPTMVRLVFVAMTIFWGVGIPLYLVAWLLMPREVDAQSPAERLLGRIDNYPRPPEGRGEFDND